MKNKKAETEQPAKAQLTEDELAIARYVKIECADKSTTIGYVKVYAPFGVTRSAILRMEASANAIVREISDQITKFVLPPRE